MLFAKNPRSPRSQSLEHLVVDRFGLRILEFLQNGGVLDKVMGDCSDTMGPFVEAPGWWRWRGEGGGGQS